MKSIRFIFIVLLCIFPRQTFALSLNLIVRANAYSAADGVLTNGSNVLTSASRSCAIPDAGKLIVVERGPQSGNTVLSCSGSGYIFNGSPAAVSDTGLSWAIGTDNSAVIAQAVSTYPRTNLVLPPGQILIGNASINLTNVSLCGQQVPQNRVAAVGDNAKSGTTLIVASYSNPTFIVHQAVNVCGLNFFWPVNGAKVSTPVATPPLFTDSGSDQLSDFTFQNSNAINPYVLFKQNAANVVLGGVRFIDNNVYAISEAFELSNIGETFSISGSIYNPSVYASVNLAGPTPNLGVWSAQHSDFLHIRGNGAAGTCSSIFAGGIKVTNHTTMVGFATLINIVGGALDESSFDDSIDANGVVNVLALDANSTITRTRLSGQYYPNGIYGVHSTGSHFYSATTCTGGLAPSDLAFSGNITGANSTVFEIAGTNLNTVSVTGSIIQNYGDTASPGHPLYAMYANNPNLNLIWSNNQSNPNFVDSNHHGVNIASANAVIWNGNLCKNTYFCMDSSIANVVGVGNNTLNTSSATAVTGSATFPADPYNLFDK